MASSESSFSLAGKSDLDLLFDFLRFRSVSTKPDCAPEMRACADWLCALLRHGGFHAEVAETGGHPAVLACGPEAPGKPTVLIYGKVRFGPSLGVPAFPERLDQGRPRSANAGLR